MSVLLELPSEVCHSILIQWFQPENWCDLDTACCSNKLRPILLNHFHLFPPVDIQIKNWSRLPYAWCYTRRIYAKNVEFLPLCFNEAGTLKNWFYFDKIEELAVVRLNKSSMKELIQAVNSCVNLKSLDVYYPEVLLNLDVAILHQLTALFITGKGFSPPCLPMIQANSTKLKTFSCSSREEPDVSVSVVTDIIHSNPDLEYLSFNSVIAECSPILQALTRCRNFHTLSLTDSIGDRDMRFTLTEIMQLQSSCPRLEDVWMRDDCRSLPENCAFTWRSRPERGNDLGLYHYDKPDLSSYLTSVRGCTRMNLSHLRMEQGDLRAMAANNSSRLESLSLEECEYDSESLGELLERCSELKELSMIHREIRILQQKLEGVFTTPNSLTRINVYSGCLTSDLMIQIITASPKLTTARFCDIPRGVDISEAKSFAESHHNSRGEKVEVVFRVFNLD